MTLLHALPNKAYVITKLDGEERLMRRLLDMGFTPQTCIYVAGIAPMGGTILVGIRGCMIALRDDAASLINIERATERA